MEHQLFSKAPGQGLLGQIVAGGAQPAGGNHHVRPAPGQLHRSPQPPGVVPHHRVVQNVQPQGRQLPAEGLGVGIDNGTQQQLGAHRQDFNGMAHGLASLRFLFPILAPFPPAVKEKGAAAICQPLAFCRIKGYNILI